MQFDICPGCMGKLTGPGPCPKCGFDAGQYTAKPHQLPPYTILDGKYLVGKVLGQGGFGITYLGWDMTLELKVAIKEYYPSGFVSRDCAVGTAVECSAAADAEEFFKKGKDKSLTEARTMAKCDGIPEVVRVRDFFEANNTVYIIMDYIEGMNIQHYLRSKGGRISMNDCIALLGPVMRAMDTVHKQFGLIHRDISPDNIMVQPDGRTRILDFGAAKSSAPNGGHTTALLLKRGLSPIEQYSDSGSQGPWTDVYAFAATIYYCITGKLPPEATGRIEADTLVPPARMGAVISREQEAALMHALAIRPADRFQTMQDFYLALTGRLRAAQPVYTQPGQAQQAYPQPGYNAPRTMPAPAAAPTGSTGAYTAPVSAPVSAPRTAVQRGAYTGAANMPAGYISPRPAPTAPLPIQSAPAKKNKTGIIAVAVAAVIVAAVGIGLIIAGASGSPEDEEDSFVAHTTQADKFEDDEDSVQADAADRGQTAADDDQAEDESPADAELPEEEEPQAAGTVPETEQETEPEQEPADDYEPARLEYDPAASRWCNNLLNGNFMFSVDVDDQSNTIYYCGDDFIPYLENDSGVYDLNGGESVMFINYTDQYLYFIDYSGDLTRICRTDHSGAGKSIVYSSLDNIMYLSCQGDWLYFSVGEHVCRIRTDGTGFEYLYSGDTVDEMACCGGSIYWLDSSRRVMTMPMEGGETTVLYEDAGVYFFQFYEGLLYCVQDYDIALIDSSGQVTGSLPISTYYFNIYNGVLYYADYDDHGIYAYDLGSGESEKLMDDPGGNPLRICAGEYDGLVTLWFFYLDDADARHSVMLIEQPDQWMRVYVNDLLG